MRNRVTGKNIHEGEWKKTRKKGGERKEKRKKYEFEK